MVMKSRRFLRRLAQWMRFRSYSAELAEEVATHREAIERDLIARGHSPAEARDAARRAMGNETMMREEARGVWLWPRLDTFVADVRYAFRNLARSWGFSLGTVAVLALGIGATVAIFSVVNTVLLRPLPYPDAARIVSVETFWSTTGRASQGVSGPDFLDWKAQSNVFEKMAVLYGNDDDVTIVNDRAVFANARYVSADFFPVFGQTAVAGRLPTERDVPAGQAEATIAVVAHHWAVAHFGSADAAIGNVISVYGSAMEIVGVSAPGFRYPGNSDIWVPSGAPSGNRDDHPYQAVAKLKPGVSLARAHAAMRTIGDNLARQHAENRHTTVAVTSLQDRLTGNVQVMLWVLMAAVLAVLLIACANISNLLLARAAARMREIALRAALGAGRGRLVRQLLTESCVLGLVAGAVGVFLAFALVPGLVAMSPAGLPRLDEIRVDTTALLFALGLSLVSTMLFGLVPAILTSRLDLSRLLKQGGAKGVTSGGGPRPRAALVITEVALSVILLAVAGLLLQSFQALQHVNLGFTTHRVLVARTEYAVDTDADILRRSRFYAEVLDRLRAVPGVDAAAGISFLPLGQEHRDARDYFIQGQPDAQPGERPGVELYPITPDYFKTLEVPLRAGRDFDRSDTPERPRVAIINEALARIAFPNVSPIGKFIRTNQNNNTPWMEIVGVVGDTRWQDPSSAPPLMLFVSSLQGAGKSLAILVRTSLDENALAPVLRTFLRDGNPNVPVRFDTMDQLFADAVASPRFRTQVIGAFAVLAALLAAVGIFSVLAYLVGQRTREIAVRRAVGAGARDVIRLVVGQGMRLVAIGLVLGLAGALAVARLLQGLLYEVSPWDVGPYLGALVVIGVAALLATLVPAVRAAAITPLIALQQE